MATKIGKDEFCLHCMEWREYDEEGRCKKCKHIIHRTGEKEKLNGYNDYKKESPSFEADEESNDTDY